ncbi:electron transfer flavoprotein subunit beta/FixA family protein [Youngiibacter fragilis]|uniref:Electron transfer flavoprotein small subunit n=1 Tax=Youngiibacter fragilis 232.1 TaxID=994573 RepID=V4GK07_9CLOT|nr:electron transfer flavoprotein subunit beta/FixA family protein [Youngiibacter fragilis]ETA81050.1 electron transfer flavoprotein subunit beta [Youngiibacter fragilis 232.1]
MKIIVCIKQVPDTSEVEIDPVTNTLVRVGIPVIMNPDDKAGIELALTIRDAVEGCTVSVITMGPPHADMVLLEALAMGCDEAYHLSGREFGGSDTLATSSALAAALKKIGYDVIVTGRQAIDGDTAQVGPQIAEHLEIPQVSYVEKIEYEYENTFLVNRRYEDRIHKLRINTPCLFTAIAQASEPRFMTVSGVINASKKTITKMGFSDLADVLDIATVGLKGSPTNVVRSFTKEPKGQGLLLDGLTADQAVSAIMSRLHESHII